MAKVRSLQEINQDYFQTAAILGDLVWKVSKFTGENITGGQIGDLKRKLRVIDNEMDEYNKEQEKQKKAATTKAKTELSNGATKPTEIKPEVTPSELQS